jgi:protein-disulfide isomerase
MPKIRISLSIVLALAAGGCRPAAQADLENLALRVDSMAVALTVLGQRVGISNAGQADIRTVTASAAGSLRKGPDSAPFVLVEFTDYYCPYCATFAVSALEDILAGATDLQVVIRNYPIREIHPDAARVASIVECLADIDGAQAWDLHYRLFARQASLDSAGVDAMLASEPTFPRACGSPDGVHPRVMSDLAETRRLELRGTPALVLGRRLQGDSVTGLLLPGAYPAGEVLRLLDSIRTARNDAGSR